MKRPPPDEEAALEAAFSFTDAIDAINQFQSESIEKISGKISLKKKGMQGYLHTFRGSMERLAVRRR
ncbi:MAG TPA: hypothetical protein VF928_07865 [Usitatibacteraceae bacterium]